MNRVLKCLALVCLAGAGVALAADSKEEGFVQLFDGKSFDGWKINENKDSWKIEDGAFVAKGERSHLFYVGDEKPFVNFELRVDVKTEPHSNGGIYFHTKYQEEGWPLTGHECQVNNTFKPDPQKTGGVYKVAKVLEAPAKDNEWFKYDIVVRGNHVVVKINDKVTADYTEDPAALAKDKSIEPGRRHYFGQASYAAIAACRKVCGVNL